MGKTYKGKAVKYTKNGQPYIIKADGKALFISKARYGKGKSPKTKSKPRKKAKGRGTTAKRKTTRKRRATRKKKTTRRRRGGVRARARKGLKRAKKGFTLPRIWNTVTDPMFWVGTNAVANGWLAAHAYMDGDETGGNQHIKYLAANAVIGGVAHMGYKAAGVRSLVGSSLGSKKRKQILMPLVTAAPVYFGYKEMSGSPILTAGGLTALSGEILTRMTGFNAGTLATGAITWDRDKFLQGGALVLGGVVAKKFIAPEINKRTRGIPVGI